MHALIQSVNSCLAVSNTFTPLLLLLRTKREVEQRDTVVEVDLQLSTFLPVLHESKKNIQVVKTLTHAHCITATSFNQVVQTSTHAHCIMATSSNQELSGELVTMHNMSPHLVYGIAYRQNWNSCSRRQQHSGATWSLIFFTLRSAYWPRNAPSGWL